MSSLSLPFPHICALGLQEFVLLYPAFEGCFGYLNSGHQVNYLANALPTKPSCYSIYLQLWKTAISL